MLGGNKKTQFNVFMIHPTSQGYLIKDLKVFKAIMNKKDTLQRKEIKGNFKFI